MSVPTLTHSGRGSYQRRQFIGSAVGRGADRSPPEVIGVGDRFWADRFRLGTELGIEYPPKDRAVRRLPSAAGVKPQIAQARFRECDGRLPTALAHDPRAGGRTVDDFGSAPLVQQLLGPSPQFPAHRSPSIRLPDPTPKSIPPHAPAARAIDCYDSDNNPINSPGVPAKNVGLASISTWGRWKPQPTATTRTLALWAASMSRVSSPT